MPGGNPNHDNRGRFSSGGGGGGSGMTGSSAHKSSYAPHAAMVKQMNAQQFRAQQARARAMHEATKAPTTHVHHGGGNVTSSAVTNGQFRDSSGETRSVALRHTIRRKGLST